ncbi:hypothetical protein C0992_006647 [Termitomyces sp. T32_za158]|nr:hypothetical protein C0992_006647 [Termitomyces sp. T32_za158]
MPIYTLHLLDIPVQPDAHVLSPASPGPSSPGTEYPFDLDLGVQMEMQLQHEFAQFNWEPPVAAPPPPVAAEWDTYIELLLGTNDFDVTAIPPIELNVSKCAPLDFTQHEYLSSSLSSSSSPASSLDPVDFIPFDYLMAAHGF